MVVSLLTHQQRMSVFSSMACGQCTEAHHLWIELRLPARVVQRYVCSTLTAFSACLSSNEKPCGQHITVPVMCTSGPEPQVGDCVHDSLHDGNRSDRHCPTCCTRPEACKDERETLRYIKISTRRSYVHTSEYACWSRVPPLKKSDTRCY